MSTKVVLITGANSGIGFELARLIAEKGHIVYVGARNEESGKKAVEILQAEGLSSVKLAVIDVTSAPSISTAVQHITAAEGDKLDVLVNNAGISMLDANQSVLSPSLDVVRTIMETNLYGPMQTTAAFLPLLRKSPSPVILNVSSGLGSNTLRANSTTEGYHFTAYNMSKAALNSYTITLARELKKEGVKVNVATPGYTATRLTGGQGQPVREGALALLPWVMLDEEGPTGKFLGPGGKEIPW
ncbi:NAD(P)-binding protein [Pholiota conissans]|uniref:NAD(P)-binding protein n=1 Tax=Pholiota conissans TaxID=109636 RepID=A0A9P5ZE88_9AGAR|nr:NAD(P)-binding protein [Pholiota conissans]